MEWIKNNIEWVSPIIVGVLAFIGIVIKNRVKPTKSTKMIQKSGKDSTNIQIGGNFNGK